MHILPILRLSVRVRLLAGTGGAMGLRSAAATVAALGEAEYKSLYQNGDERCGRAATTHSRARSW